MAQRKIRWFLWVGWLLSLPACLSDDLEPSSQIVGLDKDSGHPEEDLPGADASASDALPDDATIDPPLIDDLGTPQDAPELLADADEPALEDAGLPSDAALDAQRTDDAHVDAEQDVAPVQEDAAEADGFGSDVSESDAAQDADDPQDASNDDASTRQDVRLEDVEDAPLGCQSDDDCALGLNCCQGQCVDTTSDTDHCGACAEVCPIECVQSECLRAVQICTGDWTTCAVLNNGTIRCWGEHVGAETEQNQGSNTPVEVFGIDDAVMVACARGHACALHQDGTVSCWGNNEANNLGRPGDYDMRSFIPVGVEGVTEGVFITASSNGTCVVLEDGGVICWGQNQGVRFGLTSDGSVRRIREHSDVVGLSLHHSQGIWLHGDGSTTVTGALTFPPFQAWTPVPGASFEAVLVGAGIFHVCVVDRLGDLWCWGYNHHHQVGPSCTDGGFCHVPQRVPEATQVVSLSLGDEHTCFVNEQGQAFCFGNSGGYRTGFSTPSEIRGTPRLVENLPEPISHVSATQSYSCALSFTGQVYCWGATPGPRTGLAQPIEW